MVQTSSQKKEEEKKEERTTLQTVGDNLLGIVPAFNVPRLPEFNVPGLGALGLGQQVTETPQNESITTDSIPVERQPQHIQPVMKKQSLGFERGSSQGNIGLLDTPSSQPFRGGKKKKKKNTKRYIKGKGKSSRKHNQSKKKKGRKSKHTRRGSRKK